MSAESGAGAATSAPDANQVTKRAGKKHHREYAGENLWASRGHKRGKPRTSVHG